MKINWKRFGRDILKKRVDAKQSVRQMAKAARVTHATFSRAERGFITNAETFLKLASYPLDKDPRDYLC